MTLLVITVIVVVVMAPFVVGNAVAKSTHAAFKKEDVISALENVLDRDDSGCHDTFDLFIAWPIRDSRLEAIRQKCIQIVSQDHGESGKDLSKEGSQRIEELLNELRAT